MVRVHLSAEGDIDAPVGGRTIGVQQDVIQCDMTASSVGEYVVSPNGVGNDLGIRNGDLSALGKDCGV